MSILKTNKCISISLLSLFLCQGLESSLALDLTAPFMLESSRTLPQGVRNPRFSNVFMSIESKYSNIGNSQPLANPMQRTVKWDDVISMEKDQFKRFGISALIATSQIDPTGGPGSTSGQIFTSFNVKVPSLAMGVTDRLTIGVAVPIVSVEVSADSGFVKSADGQRFTEKLCNVNPIECNSAVAKFNNAINEKLTNYGYEPIANKAFSKIGDVRLVGKYSLYQDETQGLALQSSVVLPTGSSPNVNTLLDVPTGDGRFQIGTIAAYDRVFLKDYRWNTYGGVQALLPHSIERRIPTESGNPVSNDKETLTRNMGGILMAGTSLVRRLGATGLSAGAGYNIQYMTGWKYSGGGSYSSERYGYLEDLNPAQLLHSATLMAGFSTVEWFQQKKFVYPFQANIVFSHPLTGRNAPTNDVIAGELLLFF